MERTEIRQEIETALGKVVTHVRGEAALPCRIMNDPAADRVTALRKRLKLQPADVRRALRPRRAGRAGVGTKAAVFRTGPPACWC